MFFSLPLLTPVFYLDPGSGSILFQMLIAAFLGAGIIIRSQWARIKRWFGNKPENSDVENENENEDN